MARGRLLSAHLSEALGAHDVAVLNAAFGGAGPYEYREQLLSIGVDFEPDVVLLSYYIGNDLTNVQNHRRFQAEIGGSSSRIAVDATLLPVLRHLHAYHYALEKYRALTWSFNRFDYERMRTEGIAEELIENAKAL